MKAFDGNRIDRRGILTTIWRELIIPHNKLKAPELKVGII
jgi:hypothetical protein